MLQEDDDFLYGDDDRQYFPCPNCGNIYEAGIDVCLRCGWLIRENTQGIFCPNPKCEYLNHPENEFCLSCNNLLPNKQQVKQQESNPYPYRQPGQSDFSSPVISSTAKGKILGTDWRDVTLGTAEGKDVKLSSDERTKGTVLLGATGTGKTSVLEHLAIADLQTNTTSIIFDPHGEISERLLRIGAGIAEDRILFCEITGNLSYGFNPLEVNDPNDPLEVSRTVDSLLQVFRKHWSSNSAYAFGSRVEWVLSNTFRTIIANTPNYTLAEIPLLLRDRDFRQKLVAKVQNPQVQEFWGRYKQLESTQRPRDQWELIESTITRLSQFLSNEWLYRVLYQAKGTINFSKLIDSGKTIIFSLPIGKLGEEPASLLGSLLLGKLVTTILGRLEYGVIPPRLNIYIDEYSRFSVPVFADLWTQARKFNCGLTATIQTLNMPDEENKAAMLQAGNHICFRLIGTDAKTLAAQMPLPDPAGLMKPEPMLLYSQTPAEDIWHKGHPNKVVMITREHFFWMVGDLERLPHEEYWWFDTTYIFPEYPDWRIFTDWDMYRSSAVMLKQGIALLNSYYYDWMEHKYSLDTPITSEELNILLKIVECFAGVMGIRSVMQPFIPDEKRVLFLYHLRDHTEWMRKKILSDYVNSGKSWEYEFLRNLSRVPIRKLELDKYYELSDIPSELSPELVVPMHEAALFIGMSSHEAENLVAWKIRTLPTEEKMSLQEMVRDSANLILLREKQGKNYSPASFSKYDAGMAINSLYYIADEQITNIQDRNKKYGAKVRDRAAWQGKKLHELVAYCCRLIGSLLEKEPLYVQSHTYKDVELYRRTYSDVRDELTTKLVSLPPYQAICSLVSHAGELPVQIKTLPPLQIQASSSLEAQVKAIRERCQKELGHPWQEVYREMQTRQNLPPAKSHIPQQKP